jgi:hypothetical protein
MLFKKVPDKVDTDLGKGAWWLVEERGPHTGSCYPAAQGAGEGQPKISNQRNKKNRRMVNPKLC